ncbi:conserved hypothetical protein [Alteracholeplasma palmae J233]|uniref:DUF2179 domain-containing protein n=1 Tax=Alteracholeplasma palmae (strain ATCC 49389 / J233) TaxID=1318466 RepID=U4KLT2_ALTPJ|nr:YitT family protein [Alteracholeplasma palmae]CCV64883.1 conserved hypothetical protein [Alteracholeplasma palmae J233]
MQKLKSVIQSEQFRLKIGPEIKRFFAVVIFTLIYGLGVVWFLEASSVHMYTGGIPGLAQVIRDLLVLNGAIAEGSKVGDIFMSIFIIVGNIPVLALGWFGVSKRFTIYSFISIIIQSIVIGFIPKINLGIGSPDQALLAAIMGGLLIGIGVGGALKFGTSTGGLDIVAQYVSLKKGQSVGFISMVLNVLIALFGAIIAGNNKAAVNSVAGLVFLYTIIRIIVTTIATDKIHTGYLYMGVQIITESPKEVINDILVKLYRGVTLTKVQGAYSQHDKILIYVVISSYELQSLLDIVRRVDDKSFIITTPVNHVYGNFKKKTIA